MNDIRAALREIVRRYGIAIVDDPERLKALLLDYAPGAPRERFVVVTALEQGVVAELRSIGPTLPATIVASRMTTRLRDQSGFDESMARLAVEAWAGTLGIVLPPTPPAPRPKAAAPTPARPQPKPAAKPAAARLPPTRRDPSTPAPPKPPPPTPAPAPAAGAVRPVTPAAASGTSPGPGHGRRITPAPPKPRQRSHALRFIILAVIVVIVFNLIAHARRENTPARATTTTTCFVTDPGSPLPLGGVTLC